jgi:hypothetical protein
MMIESFSAFRLSSSWHVSTTNRNIGGFGAGWGRRYSMVVPLGWYSGGTWPSAMPL